MAVGLLNVHKPAGPTSHDIVAAVRRGTGVRRVGHAGTLDPLAQGVLVLALGQATRLLEYLAGSNKQYDARLQLGVETDTYDAEGEVLRREDVPATLTAEEVAAALASFRGDIQQVPPAYSALKVGGRAAYARARAGEQVELKPRRVTIYELELTRFDPPFVDLRVVCSAGTYIRSLAHDLGQALGTGAMLAGLVRTASGSFTLAGAVPWPALTRGFDEGSWREFLLPADLALESAPQVRLGAEGLQDLIHGRAIAGDAVQGGLARAYAPDGQFVGVLEGDPAAGVWRPRKVLARAM